MKKFSGYATWISLYETRRLTPPNLYLKDKEFEAIYPGSKIHSEDDLWSSLKSRLHALTVPFFQTKKDFLDTFKPYKSKYHLKRDLYYPLQGLKHLGESLLSLLITPFDFVNNMHSAYTERSMPSKKSNYVFVVPFIMIAVNLVHSCLYAVRAATQLLATPLVLLRAIYRNNLTSKLGRPHIRESTTVQRTVSYFDGMYKYSASAKDILELLHYKHSKALERGQPTIDAKVEDNYLQMRLRKV